MEVLCPPVSILILEGKLVGGSTASLQYLRMPGMRLERQSRLCVTLAEDLNSTSNTHKRGSQPVTAVPGI